MALAKSANFMYNALILGITLSFLLIVSILSGCSSNEYADLDGEVFVVTRGRENVRLALTQILVGETGVNAPTYPTEFVASTMTNSDGKFNVRLPKGKYRLFARATRSILGMVEKYEWVVDVDLVNGHQTVILSNHNLSTSGEWPASLGRPTS